MRLETCWKRNKKLSRNAEFKMRLVPEAGLEPARPHQTLDFESNASTDSTIRAWCLRKKAYEL